MRNVFIFQLQFFSYLYNILAIHWFLGMYRNIDINLPSTMHFGIRITVSKVSLVKNINVSRLRYLDRNWSRYQWRYDSCILADPIKKFVYIIDIKVKLVCRNLWIGNMLNKNIKPNALSKYLTFMKIFKRY